jgi:hypothetical protein
MNASTDSPEINPEPPKWPLRFVHRFKYGIVARASVAESGTFAVEWDPAFPRPNKFRKIENEYLEWRKEFIGEWAKRTGRRPLVITL